MHHDTRLRTQRLQQLLVGAREDTVLFVDGLQQAHQVTILGIDTGTQHVFSSMPVDGPPFEICQLLVARNMRRVLEPPRRRCLSSQPLFEAHTNQRAAPAV